MPSQEQPCSDNTVSDVNPAPKDEPKLRVAMVVDTPNIFRCIGNKYGRAIRPAWADLLLKAQDLGLVITAVAVVNSGFPEFGVVRFERAGYSVVRADGADCDEFVIASLVGAALAADILIVVGGDHKFADVANLARQAGRRIVVVSVPGTCAKCLSEVAAELWEMPRLSTWYFPAGEAAA